MKDRIKYNIIAPVALLDSPFHAWLMRHGAWVRNGPIKVYDRQAQEMLAEDAARQQIEKLRAIFLQEKG